MQPISENLMKKLKILKMMSFRKNWLFQVEGKECVSFGLVFNASMLTLKEALEGGNRNSIQRF